MRFPRGGALKGPASRMRDTRNMEPILEWELVNDVPILIGSAPSAPGVKVAFTCRLGGVSEAPFDSLNLSPFVGDDDDRVAKNRATALAAGGFRVGSSAFVKQVHGTDILSSNGAGGLLGEADGVLASRGGSTASVVAADCVPVLIAGEEEVVAVHAGWRGLAAGTVDRAVARVAPVRAAWVGPSIRSCCYEVGEEVLAAFGRAGLPTGRGRVDTGDAAASILARAGISSVVVATECTHCDERFFSHRRDGPTGRQGGFIAWT